MSELSLDEEPLPSRGELEDITDYFHLTCHYLERQCDDTVEPTSSGLWPGVDLPPLDVAMLPVFFAAEGEPYRGPFGEFCKKAVRTGKYRRYGSGDEPFHLRLKLVPSQDDLASITILLQQEYIGYDVFLKDGVVHRKRTGQKLERLEGDKAYRVIDDIRYVADRMISHAYEMDAHSRTLETCDSRAPSVRSKESESRPRRSFGRRALQLFKI